MSLTPEQQLFQAARAGDLAGLKTALSAGASASHQEEVGGTSAMMQAAAAGKLESVKLLLLEGAPWNATDRSGKCAGDHAVLAAEPSQPVIDCLVAAGVQAEMLFRAMTRAQLPAGEHVANLEQTSSNRKYLDRPVHYTGPENNLLDEDKRGVMMSWEDPLMKAHAEILAHSGGDVLNVGFGMGIVDTYLQSHSPRTHTIIEAHPDVYKKMIADGWDKKPGVTIVFGRWQEVVGRLGQNFDGIFFDTFDDDFEGFHGALPGLLRPGGLYSFFNGIHPENLFFQGVACEVIKQQLDALGFESQFIRCDIDCSDLKTWEGVAFNYFDSGQYFLPIVQWKGAREDAAQSAAAASE